MREIKFRAKGQTSDKWYYGSYVNMGEDVAYIQIGQVEKYICDAHTLGQFTGLTDKNGVEIYDGDIVYFDSPHNRNSGKYKVYWKEKKCGFELKLIEWPYSVKGMQAGKQLKIISNIHEERG